MGFLSWLNELFQPPVEYGTPSVTLTGQPVRRKGEKIIGDYLTHHGIGYYYEAQAMSNDWFIFKHKISKPDFFLPQYNLVIEYWGLVDSPDPRIRDDYIRSMRWKMAQYLVTTSDSFRYTRPTCATLTISSGGSSGRSWGSHFLLHR